MDCVVFGGWTAEVDVAATREMYAASPFPEPAPEFDSFLRQAAVGCVFPATVTQLFSQMGVDCARPSELILGGPTETGGTAYSGWFNVVGTLIHDAKQSVVVEPGFSLYPMADGLLPGPAFRELAMFRVEFAVDLPRAVTDPAAVRTSAST